MTEPQTQWCQPGDQPNRQFVVIFDDPDQAMAVFDNEVDARAFWEKASIDWNCHLMGALPREPDSHAASDVLRLLDHIAARQRSYSDKLQMEYPSIEDFMDDEGAVRLPDDITPLLDGYHYNGRFSEADWWLTTIREMAKRYPAPESGPVAFACEADIDMLAGLPEGYDISLSPDPMPQYGMKMPLYADRDGRRTAILEELREVRAALRPFAEALDAHGDNHDLADSISAYWALQTSKLVVTGISVGDLRRARQALVQKPTEIEKIIPKPSAPRGSIIEAARIIADEFRFVREQAANTDRDNRLATQILAKLMLLAEGAKR